ncbi:MAG TPA: FecR domain-containing protein [Puia sp.]|jgi:hypothetical protein|nr:FecR domain-containing protein [Puia sp.]
MDHQYLVREIIAKYQRGEPLTKDEQSILDAELRNVASGKVWERIRSRIAEAGHKEAEIRVIRPWYTKWPAVTAVASTAATAVVCWLAFGVYHYRSHPNNTPPDNPSPALAAVQHIWRTISPGHYHGEWQGPDGVVAADSVGAGQSVPYQVLLPDGSKAILGYNSSIRYPKAFEARKVLLAGQAYFEIAKNVRPFITQSGKKVVEVLGTKFNWMAYPGISDEITLLTGKIRVSVDSFQRELNPGERVTILDGSPIQPRKMGDPLAAIGWLQPHPVIKFDSTELSVVIRRMAQYYQRGFYVDPRLQTGRLVTGTVSLEQSLEDNVGHIRELTDDYARVEVTHGRIEVNVK